MTLNDSHRIFVATAQGDAAGLEAQRTSAAEEKEAAVRRCAKAELDLRELQERIASGAATQVSLCVLITTAKPDADLVYLPRKGLL